MKEPNLALRKMRSETQLLRGILPCATLAIQANVSAERQQIRQQLLTELDHEDSVLEQDVEAKLKTIWALPRRDQDRVVAIMRSHKLQKWITGTSSSALFLNANHKGSMRQQPTSFISAKLVDSITPSLSTTLPDPHLTLPLAYFCGEHLQDEDPDSGPDGMMRNLLSQLLLSYPSFDLHTIQRMQQSLDYTSVSDLCDIFDLLIAQLPPYTVVFCIIDSVSFYENSASVCEEAQVAVQALVDVVERTKDNGCVFKLLLMSAWNSRVLYKDMLDQEEDVAWMPVNLPAQGGYTVKKWSASVESNLGGADPATW